MSKFISKQAEDALKNKKYIEHQKELKNKQKTEEKEAYIKYAFEYICPKCGCDLNRTDNIRLWATNEYHAGVDFYINCNGCNFKYQSDDEISIEDRIKWYRDFDKRSKLCH